MLTTFEVQVRRSGDGWWVYAPAFGTGRFVSEESEIPAVARGMIAQCGAAPSRFEVELVTDAGAWTVVNGSG